MFDTIRRFAQGLKHGAEFIAAMMMFAMFLTFILQVVIRYTARLEWLAQAAPLLDPSRYGWTLEFCLALWVWIVFFGCATIVRERDHVTFDILYSAVRPGTRKVFAIVTCVLIAGALLYSLEPTWAKFRILRLKQTATLKQLMGDWIRMRDIYSVYAFFLVAVSLRYAWRAAQVFRFGAEQDIHHFDDLATPVQDPEGRP
ncbi:TRAP transporter small permease [Sagittula salina]|uniref:TRAP transporter small permease protein n=1 Tax=Sagittula salina TaxID=2820268 RepID=A0A940MMR1_9RHOB|nr:TRAP transporter small permease subunit [Sagittula salina]MBP0484735.1 TRAP transporter small permease subunit [Sagittula salina]